MKFYFILVALLILPAISGCSWTISGCSWTISMNPPIHTWNTLQVNSWNISTIATIQYSWELILAGIGPDESFESTVANDTLVLKRTFDDHSDHIFFPRETWGNYIDIKEAVIPWSHVYFVGTVKSLDAAAGNHYYEVMAINELKIVWLPTTSEIETIIQRYAYCEQDTDCVGIYGKCPLWCHIAINSKFQATVEKIVDNFWNHQDPQCTYKCMKIWKVICNASNICEVK